MKGTLFGVGVGPGDPELMTYKAVHTIVHCPVLAVPANGKQYAKAAEAIIKKLEQGKDVAYLTLGDPTIYSTYIYIHRIVKEKGYQDKIINGVPSFCAASAELGDSLVDRSQQLHIIPSSYDIEQAIAYPRTKVLMKTASKLSDVKQLLSEKCKDTTVKMVENCGMPDEHIYDDIHTIPDQTGYYSLMIVKE